MSESSSVVGQITRNKIELLFWESLIRNCWQSSEYCVYGIHSFISPFHHGGDVDSIYPCGVNNGPWGGGSFRYIQDIFIWDAIVALKIVFTGLLNLRECPKNWTYFEHTKACYVLDVTPRTWGNSQAFCKKSAAGGDLVSIHDTKTNEFILSFPNKTRRGDKWIGGFRTNVSTAYQVISQ